MNQNLCDTQHVHALVIPRTALVVGMAVDRDLCMWTRASCQQQLYDLQLGVSHSAVQGGGIALELALQFQVCTSVDKQQGETDVACIGRI